MGTNLDHTYRPPICQSLAHSRVSNHGGSWPLVSSSRLQWPLGKALALQRGIDRQRIGSHPLCLDSQVQGLRFRERRR